MHLDVQLFDSRKPLLRFSRHATTKTSHVCLKTENPQYPKPETLNPRNPKSHETQNVKSSKPQKPRSRRSPKGGGGGYLGLRVEGFLSGFRASGFLGLRGLGRQGCFLRGSWGFRPLRAVGFQGLLQGSVESILILFIGSLILLNAKTYYRPTPQTPRRLPSLAPGRRRGL